MLLRRHNNAIVISSGRWSVEFHPAFEEWVGELSQVDAEALLAAIRVLRDQGPTLGRPLVDTVKGSRHNHMKELRPGSTGRTELRVLFAFDLDREAVLLVGGDKGGDWKGWYEANIPIADARFEEHQVKLAAKPTKKPTGKATTKNDRRRGKRK